MSEASDVLVYDAQEIVFNGPDPVVHRQDCRLAPREHIVRVHGARQRPEDLQPVALQSCPLCRSPHEAPPAPLDPPPPKP